MVSAGECLLCSGSARTALFPTHVPWVVRCDDCGLVFSQPQPDDSELDAIYDEHYYEQFGFKRAGRDENLGLAATKQATYRRLLKVAEPFIDRQHERRLLDVGCGLGYSLLAATAAGWQARGLDPLAPESELPGRRIDRGVLGEYSTGDRFTLVSLVSLVDVIEHVRDPVAAIRHAAELFDESGLVLLATNNVASLPARWMGHRWTHYLRAHLWYFTPETLSRTVEAAGLEVCTTRPAARVYNLQYIASILARDENFPAARRVARSMLAAMPQRLLQQPWPPVLEGFVVVARRPR